MAEKKVIDIHIHIGGMGDSGSGCKMSYPFIFSFAFAAMLIALKTTPFDLKDETIRERILEAIETSERIDYGVLLALDGVYQDGRYRESQSHLVVPNDYVIGIAKKNPRVLLGASVHPYRKKKEMLAETERCIDEGAVLFKWIPSSQQIDPRDGRCYPFYELLAKQEVPLLCHTGGELAVPTSDPRAHRFNDPRRLKKALEMGVTVIAAHCAAPYLGGVLPADRGYFEEMLHMLRVSPKKGWHLYGDLSAFCTPTRIFHLRRIREEIRRGNIRADQFLFGSDFPIPIVDIALVRSPLDLRGLLRQGINRRNPLDENYRILKACRVPDPVFTNAWDVLRLDRLS